MLFFNSQTPTMIMANSFLVLTREKENGPLGDSKGKTLPLTSHPKENEE